ncbi:hypothetical protein M3Y97_00851700 [Aphelenchoides bicaudatus]|nr:hypothetical protein M3Y97_00851700 [Aphelenchoides bicaudatus]
MSYGHSEPRHHFYGRNYYLDEEDSRTHSSAIKKCSVGTSTSGGYLDPYQQQQTSLYSPSYRDASLSPQPSSSVHFHTQQHYHSPKTVEINDQAHYHNSPLSDSLLLALRRSRPNTRLFRALYQYIPLRDSPNEQPHLELTIHAGDYILVHGNMDEDQFYFGETLAGRVGLVPSNFVERIPDYVLLQNASRAPSPANAPSCTNVGSAACCSSTLSRNPPPIQPAPASFTAGPLYTSSSKTKPSISFAEPNSTQVVPDVMFANGVTPLLAHGYPSTSRPASPSFTLNVPQHHTQIAHDFTELDSKNPPLPDSVCPYPPIDVSKIKVQEIKNPDKPRVPFPRELTVEKKLSRSVVLSWLPPEDQLAVVSQYHVCVDSVVKAVVPGTYKTKALIEDLNLDKSVNVSVRALTENGQSPDTACTLAIGAEAPVAPQHLRVSNITPISVNVNWYPSNSNAEHVVLLNAIKIGICPPSVYQAIGLPDPPNNVQVEIGPQPGTLLISWKPVQNQPKPPSRAAVQSYLIFADGRNIAAVPSPTADHILLRLADFADDPPIFITVRTKTKEGAVSADSNVVRVPRAGVTGFSNSFSGASTSALNNLAEAFKLTNALSNVPLASASLPTSLIGQTLPGADLNPNQQFSSMSMMPPNVLQGGLLTTVAQPGTANPLNTAFLPQQSAIYFPQQATSSLAGTLAQDSNVYTTAAAQLNALALQQYQQQQAGTQRISDTIYEPQQSIMQPSMYPTQHPHKFLGRSNTSALLHNGSVPKYPSSALNKQYYTFHPKALFKEFTGTEEKPSVLEMENNYLLKYRQQHRGPQNVYDQAASRYDYYGRPARQGTSATIMPGSRRTTSGGMNPALAQPRIARVRSDEFLGTRSEPDLRPPIYSDDESVRWFVALYDYNFNMSPNPNAQQEELSFYKHQLIKVHGDVDPDGFYRGQIGRRYGLVPSNMVIEIAKDDLIPSSSRRLPQTEPEYHGPTGSSIPDTAARRMRWGSMKSRSYDVAERRPAYYSGHPADTYSSLDRRDTTQQYPGAQSRYYDSVDSYPHTSTSIRPGAYAPRYSAREMRGSYERSSSYDPRVAQKDYYPTRQHLRRGEPGWEYSNDHRDARDIREGAATIRSGERFNEAQIASRYGTMPRQMPSDYARTYDQRGPLPGSAPTYAKGEPWQPDQAQQQSQPYGQAAPPVLQQQTSQTSQQMMPPMDAFAQQSNVPPVIQQPPTMPQVPQNQLQQQQMGMQTSQIQQQQQMPDDRFNRAAADMLPTKQMIAKYDYDSRQLSPNVDAEQVELSFRMNDIITVFGDMDDDGFYMGELNGVRGLVPSNFLQEMPSNSLLAPNAIPMPQQPQVHKTSNAINSVMAGPITAYGASPTVEPQTRPKGVMFSDTAAKPAPIRQTSQTSSKMGVPVSSAMSAPSKAAAPSKPAVKKASDSGGKGAASNATRKPSQGTKKDAIKKKT